MSATVLEHAPGIFEISSRIGGTIRIAQWLIVSSGEAMLIDTGIAGTTADVVEPALAEIGIDATHINSILLTHCDVDHCGGTSEIFEIAGRAEVLAHPQERGLIESWRRLRDERYRWVEAYGLEVAPETEAWLETAFGAPISVSRTVVEGNVISVGDVDVQMVELAGHAPGLLGGWLPEAGVLIGMDAVFGRGADPADPACVTPPQYGSVERYRATIDRIASLSPTLLGSSHFEPLRGDDVVPFLNESRAFVDDLGELVAAELDTTPTTLAQLTKTASDTLGPFRTDFHELTRSVHAHLRELSDRGEAESVKDSTTTTWRTP